MPHKGSCFCGAVKIEVDGAPEGMGYCHCRSCRSWSGGPVNAFSLWKPEAVRITSGADQVAMFQKTEVSQRQYCKKCGGHLMTIHPPLGLVDVFAAIIPTLTFTPGVHVNYSETVLPMRDGLPKLKDFPKGIAPRHSLVTSSTMLRMRKRRPLANWSWTKSSDQRALALASTRIGARVPTAFGVPGVYARRDLPPDKADGCG